MRYSPVVVRMIKQRTKMQAGHAIYKLAQKLHDARGMIKRRLSRDFIASLYMGVVTNVKKTFIGKSVRKVSL